MQRIRWLNEIVDLTPRELHAEQCRGAGPRARGHGTWDPPALRERQEKNVHTLEVDERKRAVERERGGL